MTILKPVFKKKQKSFYKRIGIALVPSASFTVVPNYTHPKIQNLKGKSVRKYAAIASAIAGGIALPRVVNELDHSDSFDSVSSDWSSAKESIVLNPSAGLRNKPCATLPANESLQQTIKSENEFQESQKDDYELKDTGVFQTLEEPELQLFTENDNVFIYLMQKIVEKNIENKKVDFYRGADESDEDVKLSKRRRKKRKGMRNLKKLIKSKSLASLEKDIESTCSEGESENDLIRAKEKKLKKRSCVAQLKEKMATSTVASLESGYGKYLKFEPRKLDENDNKSFKKENNGKIISERKIETSQQKGFSGSFKLIKRKEDPINLKMSSRIHNKVQELECSLNLSRQENSELLSKFHKLNLEYSQLRNSFEGQKIEKENCLRDLELVKTELKTLQQELKIKKNKVEEQNSHKNELQSLIDKLKDELNLSINKSQHKSEIRKLRNELVDITNKNLDETSNYKALLKIAQLDLVNAKIKNYTSQANLKLTQTENEILINQNNELRTEVELLKTRNKNLILKYNKSTQHLSNVVTVAGQAVAEKGKADKILAEAVACSEVYLKLRIKDKEFIGDMQEKLRESKFKVFNLQNEVEEKLKDQEKHYKLDLLKLKYKLNQINSNLLEKKSFILQTSEKQRKLSQSFSALCSSASLETKNILYNHVHSNLVAGKK